MDHEINWLLTEKYHGEKTPEFFKDAERIGRGEPADYVIGFTDFLGCKIDLSFRPMIPRVETEFWVEKAMADLKEKFSALDIFAGSGCIGIALLKKFPEAKVDFAEKDPNLVLQIEKNLASNDVQGQVYISDVFENVPQKKYDYIFANPPYIHTDRKWQVAKSVLEHEPHLALFAEDKGLFFIKKILNEAGEYLAPNGKLFIEFDEWQKESIEMLLDKAGFKFEFWKDQFNKWRTVVIYF